MAASNFNQSLALTLGYEGGWSNRPPDPPTMCGITQQVYDIDRDRRRVPLQSVRCSTEAERAAIYRWRYWGLASCDVLPIGVDYAVFDFAVNSGVSRSVKTLQGIVGAVQDGNCGKYTLSNVSAFCGQYGITALTDQICHKRLQFLQNLSGFAVNGNGWTIRVMGHQCGTQLNDTGVVDRAFAMASGTSVRQPAAQIVTPKTYNATSLATVTGTS